MSSALARHRYFIDYTVASLWRRKGRTLGLLLVYATLVFLVASVLLYSHALKREATFLLQDAPEVVVQKLVAGRHDLIGERERDQVRGIRGVRAVEGRLWGYYFDPTVAANYTLMAPANRPVMPGTVIIGDGIARARGAGEGDHLSFRGHDGRSFTFAIAQVLPHESAIVAADLVLMSDQDYRALFGIAPGLYTDLALVVGNAREARTIAEKVVQRLPNTRPVLRSEILRTYDAIFDWREGLLLLVLSGAGLAFAIFAWDQAAGLRADERREIGILKAIGWDTADVLKMKLWEGALISLGAFLVGFVLAYGHVFIAGAPLFAPVLKGWSVLYPELALTPAINGLQLVSLLVFTVVPYTAATLIPAWRAAAGDPDAVMR